MTVVATNKLNVLVADDEMASTTTVAFVLKRSGHHADVVQDGSDALKKIHESPGHYHLLITDHAMQEVSGFELVERLHDENFPGQILVLSAFLTRNVKESYQALGVTRFMEKPFDLTELREVVNEIAEGLE